MCHDCKVSTEEYKMEARRRRRRRRNRKDKLAGEKLGLTSSRKLKKGMKIADRKFKRTKKSKLNGHSANGDSRPQNRKLKRTKKSKQSGLGAISHSEPQHSVLTPLSTSPSPHVCECSSKCAQTFCDTTRSRRENSSSNGLSSTPKGQNLRTTARKQCSARDNLENKDLVSGHNRRLKRKVGSVEEDGRESWTRKKRQRLAAELSLLLNPRPAAPVRKLNKKRKSPGEVKRRKESPPAESAQEEEEEEEEEEEDMSEGIGNSVSCAAPARTAPWYWKNPLPVFPPARPVQGIPGPEEYVALDCEFVGVGEKNSNALGRCSIIDFEGQVLYDKVVLPEEPITDYRTPWSGLRPRDMKGAVPFADAQLQIVEIIQNRIVIGHAVFNDFRVMNLVHPQCRIRDTSQSQALQVMLRTRGCLGARSLRDLTQCLLGRKIQTGEHDSVEDARAALDLYKLVRSPWEMGLLPPCPPPSCCPPLAPPAASQTAMTQTQAQASGAYSGSAYSSSFIQMTTFSQMPQPQPAPSMVSPRLQPMQQVFPYVSYLDDQYWPASMGN